MFDIKRQADQQLRIPGAVEPGTSFLFFSLSMNSSKVGLKLLPTATHIEPINNKNIQWQ